MIRKLLYRGTHLFSFQFSTCVKNYYCKVFAIHLRTFTTFGSCRCCCCCCNSSCCCCDSSCCCCCFCWCYCCCFFCGGDEVSCNSVNGADGRKDRPFSNWILRLIVVPVFRAICAADWLISRRLLEKAQSNSINFSTDDSDLSIVFREADFWLIWEKVLQERESRT